MKIHASLLPITVVLLRRFLSSIPVLLLGVALPGAQAATLLPKVYVASTGNDANTGAQQTPKRTFASAITAVAPGGEIVALDTANYAGVTINKPLTITVVPGAVGYVLAGGNANGINVAAGSQDFVTLRGLTIQGGSNANTGGLGIGVTGAGSVQVDNCKITNFATGILFSTASTAHFLVSNCNVSNCFNCLTAYANAANQTTLMNAVNCILTDASSTAVTASTNGNNSTNTVTLSGCTVAQNYIALLTVSDASTIYAGNCLVVNNTYGFDILQGGAIESFGNNMVNNNANSSTFGGTVGLQ